jgi:hypothetical protein
MRDLYKKRIGRLVDEIVVLLRAHAFICEKDENKGMIGDSFQVYLESKYPNLAGVLSVCERLRKEAEYADDDLMFLRHRSVPKEVCGDKGCPRYGKNLVWDDDGCAICEEVHDV